MNRIPGYKKPVLSYDYLWVAIPDGALCGSSREARCNGENPVFGQPATHVDTLVDNSVQITRMMQLQRSVTHGALPE